MKRLVLILGTTVLFMAGCAPATSPANSSTSGSNSSTGGSGAKIQLSFTTSNGSSLKSLLGARSITSGSLGATDTFSFVESSWNEAEAFTAGLSTNTGPGLGHPFYVYNTALGPNTSDGTPNPSGSTNSNKYFEVTVGGSTSTAMTVMPMSSITGAFDEAFLVLNYGSTSDASGNHYDFGPHFNIYAAGSTTNPTVYGASGYPGEQSLQFNGVSLSKSQPYIFFVPSATSGVTKSTGFSSPISISTTAGDTSSSDIAQTKTTFLNAVSQAIYSSASATSSMLTTAQSTYFSGFFSRYCEGTNGGAPFLGGSIGGTIIFEIVPIPSPLDFGDGSKVVSMNVNFSPATASYDNSTNVGVLNVVGTPPLNFSVDVSN